MKDIDEQALNKKLMKWRGLCWHEYPISPSCSVLQCTKCGEMSFERDNPDFVNSLDDCFNLIIIPKDIRDMIIRYTPDYWGWDCELYFRGRFFISPTFKIEKPALAVCLALERVIDETRT